MGLGGAALRGLVNPELQAVIVMLVPLPAHDVAISNKAWLKA
jgi:hypothetical protein